MIEAFAITRMQDEATLRWHQASSTPPQPPKTAPLVRFIDLVEAHHHANFDLWHEEDKARDPDASYSRITEVKHAIDRFNQRRNDLVETMDRTLLDEAGEQNPDAPLHSESPGLILDRLSILALKIYHTAEETRRDSASEEHRTKNAERLALLEEQRTDLAHCLDQLWLEVLAGGRRFKLYRQMKMYNDPDLNPAVYARKSAKLKPPSPA